MLDFDLGGEAFEPWCALVRETAPDLLERLVVETTPSGGRHVAYRCEGAVSGNLKLAQRKEITPNGDPVSIHNKTFQPRREADGTWSIQLTLIETRGNGGIFLCAPSEGYHLTQGDFTNLPVLTAEEREILLEAAWSLNECVPPAVAVPTDPNPPGQGERPGDAFNRRGDIVALLRQHGWTLARDGENQYWRRPGKAQGWSATLKGRVFYVFSSNATPFESDHAYGPFAVYTLFEHNGDYAKAAATLRTQGYGSPPDAPSATFESTTSLITELRTLGQLVDQFPNLRKPLIHGLLREGETANIIAPPKLGKSFLAIDLALAVATGSPWLGHFMCEPGKVLIMDNELHPETSANRIPKVAEARGISMGRVRHRIFVLNLRGHLRDLNSLASTMESLARHEFKLIICDAFYRFLPRDVDENSNADVASLYNLVDRYAFQTGAAFILIHHTSKGHQSEKTITDIGAGAGAQSRAADAHIGLRYHEENDAVVLEATVRNWSPPPPLCLRWTYPVWNPDDKLDPTLLRGPANKRRHEEPADQEPAWTAQRFAAEFVTSTPVPQAVILNSAREAGLSARMARELLATAEHQQLVHRWTLGRSHRADFATVPPDPETEEHLRRK
jgi:hypothetical protein